MANFYVLDGVKAAREGAGLSADALAAQSGITARTLAAIEGKSRGARRKILLAVKHAINTAAKSHAFAAEPVLAKGLPGARKTSVSGRFPKGIRVEYTKKRNRDIRPA